MTSKFKRLAAAAAVFMAASLGATQASAHTTAFGYDSLLDGTVDFWLGTYHSFAESPTTEGSLTLSGPGAAGPYAFTMPSSTLPTGLDVYTENTNVTILSWQGVNVSGLLDGAFTADITGMSSAKWARSTSSSFGFPGLLPSRLTLSTSRSPARWPSWASASPVSASHGAGRPPNRGIPTFAAVHREDGGPSGPSFCSFGPTPESRCARPAAWAGSVRSAVISGRRRIPG